MNELFNDFWVDFNGVTGRWGKYYAYSLLKFKGSDLVQPKKGATYSIGDDEGNTCLGKIVKIDGELIKFRLLMDSWRASDYPRPYHYYVSYTWTDGTDKRWGISSVTMESDFAINGPEGYKKTANFLLEKMAPPEAKAVQLLGWQEFGRGKVEGFN
jgi:hypothetical protein